MKLKILLCLILLIVSFASPVYSLDEYIIKDELSDLENGIPGGVRDSLPDDLFNQDKAAEYLLSDNLGVDFFINQAVTAFKDALIPSAGVLSKTLAIVIICSLFNAMKSSIGNGGTISPIFEMCSGICIALSLYEVQISIIEAARLFISQICSVMNLMIPVMGALYVAGGNATSAVVNSGSLMLMITLLENVCSYVLVPVMQVCFAVTLVNSISGSCNFGGLTKAIKKAYTIAIGFLMAVFAFVMTYKNILAESTDTLITQTAKFALGNMIPIVGGALGDAVKTISGSVSVLKNASGILGIIVIVILLIPAIISLLMNKFSLSLCSGAALMLGCDREGSIIKEMNEICGFALAMVSASSVMFIFSLTLFVQTNSAISRG